MKFEFPLHDSVLATKKRVIAFEFTAINKIDQGLMKMSARMNSENQDFKQPLKGLWYKNIAMKVNVTLHMRQFSSYAKSKAIYNDESVTFIVTDASEDTRICDNAVRIVSYTNGELDDQDFETPSPYQIMTPPLVAGPPGKPSVVNTTSNSIDLKWKKPQEYPEHTHSYKVLYCSRDDLPNSQWKSQLTNSVVEHITISELIPNKCYYFKVQALYHKTASKESLVSDAISTEHVVFGPPGECRAEDVTHDSVMLYWSKPPNINPSKIERYKVLYRFDSDPHGDWKSKITEDEKTTIKIDGLSPKTKYIFKVQAGSSDHHFGKESKESDVIMTESAICSSPGKPQVDVRDSSVVQLKWTKPLKYAGTIQHYIVLYSSLDEETQQWQKYDQNSTTEEILVKGLSPNTRYCFKIIAECKSGASEESETSNTVQTLVPVPSKPGQPVAVSVTSKSINLIWAKPAQYPEYVTMYCVSYRSQESKEWLLLHVDGERKTVTVAGLSPKTTYLFKVQAQSKTGSSEMSEVSTAICILPPDPTQPGQPQAVNISHDKITITWAKPQENAEYIQNYTIHYKSLQKSDTHGWTTVKTESAVEKLIVSGLEVDTSYIFKVQAESVDGPSKESETSNVIQTLVPIPSKPGQPKSVSVTHNSVSLKWTKPTHYSEYVMNYHVNYCSQEQSKEWLSPVTGLSPKITYLFKVQAQSKTGFSEMSDVSTGIRTLPPVPSQPGQPQAVYISHDKITITWAKPQENAEYIHSYTIHYKSLQKSDRHGWTTLKTESAMEVLVVSGLEINTSYIFKVQAESVDGHSKESQISNAVWTLVPVPSKPGQPVAVSVTSKSINLIWAKPAQYPEYVTKYCVSYCSQELKEWLSLHVDGDKETVTVTGLSPKTTYLFKVQAQSKTGSSEMSEVSTAICLQPPDPTQPGQPQALNISHDEITITWAKPQENAEYLQNYTIHYKSLHISDTHGWTTVKTESAVEKLIVSRLEVDTSYIFKVQAESVDGPGKESETSNVIQTLVPIPSKPGQPKAVSITHNSVSLKWDKPTHYSEYVMNYHVNYCSQEQSKEWLSLRVRGEKETVTVTGLFPKITYLFKVQAQSKTGFSEMSEISTGIRTLPPVPSQPGQPQAVHISHDKITITWAKPRENAEYIHSYTIHYKSLQKSDRHGWTTVKTESAMEVLVVSGLEINTSYIFKVQAESVDGPSKESETSNVIQTVIPIPSKPGQPKAVSVTHNNISLKWTKPTQYSEYVMNYHVSYCSQKQSKEWLSLRVQGEKETVAVTGLFPKTTYLFRVKAQSKTGFSEMSQVSTGIHTLPPVPSQPGQPKAVNISHDKVIITWAKLQENAEYIQNYTICYKSLQKSDHHVWTKVKTESAVEVLVVSGLKINTSYIFKVQAESVDGPGKESETSNVIQTLVPIPSKPGQPKAVSITHNSVNLKWAKPTHYSEYVMNYHVSYCPQEQSKEWLLIHVRGEKEIVTVTGLSPKTTYLFKVQAQSKTGFSEMSEISTGIHTLPPVPSQPGQPQAINKSHDKITITWAKPQENAEYIQNYIIYYMSLSMKPEKQEWTKMKTESAVDILEISGLSPKTTYLFKVQAQTKTGFSEMSEVSTGIYTLSYYFKVVDEKSTLCEAKHPVNTLPAPGQPLAVNVTHNSVKLTWEEPKPCNETVDHYIVSCYCIDDDEDDKIFKTENNETSIVILGLAQETSYQFRVSAQYKTGLSKVSRKSKAIQTNRLVLVAGPPGKPSVVNTTSNSIDLSWKKPRVNPDNIDGYKVLYCSKDDPPNSEWKSQQTNGVVEQITISGLVPENQYYFKVQAVYNNAEGETSKVSEAINTKYILPSPAKPRASQITHDSLKLYWSEPMKSLFKDYDKVQCYKILSKTLHHDSHDTWKSRVIEGTRTNTTIHGLSPATKYIFKVQAGSSDHHFGKDSSESEVIATKHITPGRPGKPHCVNIGDSFVQLQWTKPIEHAETVEHYVVSYSSLDEQIWQWKQIISVSEEIIVSQLSPNTRYSFKIQAISNSISGKESETSNVIQTLVPIPGTPGQPKADSVTRNSVNLKWTKPTQYSEYVMNYHVSYCPQEQSKEWLSLRVRGEEETVTVTGLSPKTTYLFKVQAQSKTGFSEMSEISTGIRTLPPVPSQPGQPQAINKSHDKITITWAKPQENAEYIQNYIIYYMSLSMKPEKQEWTTVKTESAVDILEVSGLSPKTTYLFKVQAQTKTGFSEMSEVSTGIYTLSYYFKVVDEKSTLCEAKHPVNTLPAPGQPLAVNVTHNSVKLTWEEPKPCNETVDHYIVSCYCIDDDDEDDKIFKTENNETSIVILGLAQETTYQFRVRAQYKTGVSKVSRTSKATVTTPLLLVAGPPGKPSVVNTTSNSIDLSWKKPRVNPDNIDGYKVLYCSKDDPFTSEWKSQQTNGVVEQIMISGLLPEKSYNFKVQAMYNETAGKTSTSCEVVTKCRLPSPSKPAASKITHDSLKLHWIEPMKHHSKHYDKLQSYKVLYRSPHDSHDTWESRVIEGRNTNTTIHGLSPATEYIFKVQAVSSDHQFSEDSKVSDVIKTKQIMPGCPGRPHCDKNGDTCVQLRWTKPMENAETVEHYQIFYQSRNEQDQPWHQYNKTTFLEEITVTGLTPHTRYCFTVQAISKHGSGEKSMASDTVHTLVPIPGIPGQPEAVSSTHNSVNLKWTKPTEYAQHVMNYRVSYCSQEQQSKQWLSLLVSAKKENFEVTGLFPKTTYLFRVQALNQTGSSEMSAVSMPICTLTPVPSPPGQPRSVSISQDEIKITWNKPQENAEYCMDYN